MGTKVQCKSYSPVYYAMRDLNEDANSGSWPLYYEDKILNNGQYYNCFLPRSRMDEYSDYDKEILKQTMLEHETVFRNQVYELHRLYRTQRDLMNEVRRKELQNYQRSVEASQPSPFSSQTPSEEAKKMWQIRNFPLMNSSCSIPSTSGANNMQSPLNFIKESSIQASLNPTRNGGILKDHAFMESKSKQVMTRGFDLQLPANEYLDNEVEQIKEETASHASVKANYPLETNCSVVAEIDFKLSLGSRGSPSFRGDASESISCSWNKHGLADLNQPVQVQETTAPAPVNFLGPATRYGEVQRKDSPAKPNSLYSSFPRDFIRSTQRDRNIGSHINDTQRDRNIGSHINDLRHLENGERRERPCHLEAGPSSSNFNSFLQGFGSEKLPTQSEPVQIDSRKAHEPPGLPFCDYNKREPWRESANHGSEISERSQNHSSYNYLGPVVKPCMPSPYPNVPQSDTNSEFPPVSSWMKPINKFSDKSIEVQAVSRLNSSAPFFKGSSSSVQNSVPFAEKWYLGSYSKSNSSCGKEISYRNGFCHGSQSESNASQNHFPSSTFDYPNCSNGNNSAMEHLENHSPVKYFRGSDCRDVKSAKDMMNLNLSPQNGFRDGVVSQRDNVLIDGERKNEDPPRGLPWLRAKLPPCNGGTSKGKGGFSEMGLDSLPVCSHQNTSYSAEVGKVPTPSFFQQITSATETQRIKVDSSQDNPKILGFPIFDKSRISMDQQSFSLSSNPHQYPCEVEVIQNNRKTVCSIDLSREPALPMNVVAEKEHEKEHSGFRNHFNLNVCINEEETSSITYVPESKVKIVLDIDLEAPAPEALEDVSPDGDSSTNQTDNLVQASQIKEDPLEELARMASEAIVMMSCLSIHNNLEDSTSPSSEESLKDALTWFADAVSSNMGDPESEAGIIPSRGKGNSDREESPCELDYFELMTLQLAETNLEDYCCKIWVPETQNEEETGTAATTLLTRRRRGQARRGRQKRDFQRDILPGLASLSRHEVTEDMQTFGGLMRATGHSWQTGSTRRNAGRNGATRGRKPRSQTPVTTVVICSPPRQQQPNNSEVVGIEEGSLKGWGKTTRRPRRQRLPAGSPLALTQV